MTNATYTISQSPEWRLQIISFARPRVFQTQRCIYNSHIRRREGEHFTLEKLEPKIEWKSCQWKDLGSVLFLIFFFFFYLCPMFSCRLAPSDQRLSPLTPSYVISCRRWHFQYGDLTCGDFSRGSLGLLSQCDFPFIWRRQRARTPTISLQPHSSH